MKVVFHFLILLASFALFSSCKQGGLHGEGDESSSENSTCEDHSPPESDEWHPVNIHDIAIELQFTFRFYFDGNYYNKGGRKYFQSRAVPGTWFYISAGGRVFHAIDEPVISGQAPVAGNDAIWIETLDHEYYDSPDLLLTSVLPDSFALFPESHRLSPNECSTANTITLTAHDAEFPTVAPLDVSLPLNLQWSYFLDGSCLIPLTFPLSIPAGSSSLTFYVKSNRLGSASLAVNVQSLEERTSDFSILDFAATARSLQASFGFTMHKGYYQNARGANEKYILSNAGQWYYILPTGEVHRFNGEPMTPGLTTVPRPNAEPVAILSPAYYNDPTLLLNAR